MKIELNDFFVKFKDRSLVKPLPNFLDDGSIGDNIVEALSMFIKGTSGGKMYYDSLINPILNKNPIAKHFSSKINTRYYSYALVDGQYKMISYGVQLYRIFKKHPELFEPTNDKCLMIRVNGNRTIPDYTDSYVVTNNNTLYSEDVDSIFSSGSENILHNTEALKKYIIENRPISIASLIESYNILKYPEAFTYLTKIDEVKEYLTPIYRKSKIDNLADL
jgi:hypothetical protein